MTNNKRTILENDLLNAVTNGDEDTVASLINQSFVNEEVNLNVENNLGQTPLYLAVQHGNEKIVNHLLSASVEVDREDFLGVTPLYAAVHNNKIDIARELSKNGASSNSVFDGKTPFLLAVLRGNDKMADTLIRFGDADLDSCTTNGMTALHLAAVTKNEKLFSKLIEFGANPKTKDENGKTPNDYLNLPKNSPSVASVKPLSSNRDLGIEI